MSIRTIGLSVFSVTLLIALGSVPHARAEDELPATKHKWVDVNDDCVSKCDPVEYICPCRIF